jgi:hypothetical protein
MLVRKPQKKIPLGKSTCRWEKNIKIMHKYIGHESVNKFS